VLPSSWRNFVRDPQFFGRFLRHRRRLQDVSTAPRSMA
jgi:hypothetical protein